MASFAVPFGLAALCAGDGMGFYDSPELAAAGVGLGVTHPPGHPLFVVLAAMATLVPVGSAPFRLVLVQAACLGLVGRLAFGIGRRLARRVGDEALSPRVVDLAALAGALAATLGPGVLRQASRVEVYALAALVDIALLALATRATPAAARLRLGALVLGLGAANHHFIALTAAPLLGGVALARLREVRARGVRVPWRSLTAATALFLLGLVPYALLPLRADAPSSLARVRSWMDLLEVASARIYARNTGVAVPGSAGTRVLDVLDWLGASLTPVGLLFAVGGLYLAARVPAARGDARRLALLALVVAAARAWLGFVRDNPDAAGYLVPAIAALGIAAAAFVAGSWRALALAPPAPQGPSRGARAVLYGVLVGGPLLLPAYLAFASMRATAVDRTHAPETLALASLGALPPRSVLFAYEPNTAFRLRYAMLVEGERPDVTAVPALLLGYPGMVPYLLARDGALRPLIAQHLLRPDQGLSPRLLSSLATSRTVAIELDPGNVRENVTTLLPRGPVAQVMSEPTTLVAVRAAASAHFARLDQLATLRTREPAAEPLVTEVLLWHAYSGALFFAARGARNEARRAVTRGLELAPGARELEALREALAQPGEGSLDITPFLTGATP
jgi:hypothetical protein